jgi:DNA-binding transcriptional LysR family regulator
VAPFDRVLDQGVSYFLVYPPHRGSLSKIRALRDWLNEAARPHLIETTAPAGIHFRPGRSHP